MARYTGPVCRLCRREGVKLYLKGAKCYSPKCPLERRHYAPGQHGQSRRRKMSDYGRQLREKQKVRRMYGVMERQFKNYYKKATRMKGVAGENLLQLLERRLDNVIYRLGLAVNRRDARQLVRHRHITVNGRIVNIPSFIVREGDVIEVKARSKELIRIQQAMEVNSSQARVPWLEFDEKELKGKVVALPQRSDIDPEINEQLIIELYSK